MKYIVALAALRDKDGMSQRDLMAQMTWALNGRAMNVDAVSSMYHVDHLQDNREPAGVHAVAWVSTDMSAQDLHAALDAIETATGGASHADDAPVTLTLVAADTETLPDTVTAHRHVAAAEAPEDGQLILPHPEMHIRPDILLPLAEISPQWRHPVLDRTVSQLLGVLSDPRLASARPLEAVPDHRKDVAE